MAFLLPLMQPVATAAATYFGITGATATVTTTVTTSIAPALSLVATKTAQMAGLYMGSKMLDWSCTDASQFLKEYCFNYTMTDLACMSMEGKRVTSCVGSWILSGGIFYDGIDLVSKLRSN